jgi:hypothetical protein
MRRKRETESSVISLQERPSRGAAWFQNSVYLLCFILCVSSAYTNFYHGKQRLTASELILGDLSKRLLCRDSVRTCCTQA